MKRQTILIADDHSIIRDGIRAVLSNEPNIEIIAEAKDGHEAIDKARELKPNIVLLDISMPIINGTEAIRHIKQRNSEIKIIVLTIHDEEEYVQTMLGAGADGYVLKDDCGNGLLASIHNVQKGNVYLSPGICRNVMRGFLKRPDSTGSLHSLDRLTPREREVLKLIAEDNTSRQIAERLRVSINTVEKHRYNFMRKLDLHSISAVTRYAIKNGLRCD